MGIEEFVHKSIREILLVGHRQAFAWIDEWFGMSIQDVRDYEVKMQEETNEKVKMAGSAPQTPQPLEEEAGGSASAGPVRTSISKIRDFKLGVNHSPQMDLPGDSFQWKQSVDNIGKPKMHFGPESSL